MEPPCDAAHFGAANKSGETGNIAPQVELKIQICGFVEIESG
jgi:hypothetical protein